MAKSKTLKKWRRQARAEGWRVEKSGGGHWKWFHPDGETLVITADSPGGGRSMDNAAAQLRRAGLDVST